MMYKWDIDEAIRIVKDEKITVLMGAPVMLLELLKNEQFGDDHAAHLTNVSAGGAATPSYSRSCMRPKPALQCQVVAGA